MADPEITLTDSQVRQLIQFYEEKGHRDKGLGTSILLRAAPHLGGGYFEASTLDPDGKPTADKRVLFPT
jgi:hypothetical protein